MVGADFWKWTTGVSVALLIGFVGGQYTPNRNIVLRDELVSEHTAEKASTDALTESNKELSNRLEGVEMQLAAINATLKIAGGAPGSPTNPVRVQ